MKKYFGKIILTSLIILSSSINFTAEAKRDFQSGRGLNIGEHIPTFDLESESHKMMKFNENFRGKVLLLTVGNYCNKDLAGAWTIGIFYRFYENKNFAYPFVFSRRCVPFYIPNAFVSQSAKSTADQVRMPYFLMDWDESITEKLRGSKEDPHVYVVDKKGVVRYKLILTTPFVSRDKIEKTITDLLNE